MPLAPCPAFCAGVDPSRARSWAAQDFEHGSLYGLEKFWAFHHYTGFPKDQPQLEMHAKVGPGWGQAAAGPACAADAADALVCCRCARGR